MTPAADATQTPPPEPSPPPADTVTPVPPTATPTPARPTRVTLDFTSLPDWQNAFDSGTATAANGILTIDAPAGFNEFLLEGGPPPPGDPWLADVSNERGWWVETRMRVDPLTEDQCDTSGTRGPALTTWLTDDTNELVQIGWDTHAMCLILGIDSAMRVPMDTTDGFHVYRVARQLRRVRVWVDGVLVIDQQVDQLGGTIQGLVFGDGQAGHGPTRSYWDYFTYDVSGP